MLVHYSRVTIVSIYSSVVGRVRDVHVTELEGVMSVSQVYSDYPDRFCAYCFTQLDVMYSVNKRLALMQYTCSSLWPVHDNFFHVFVVFVLPCAGFEGVFYKSKR